MLRRLWRRNRLHAALPRSTASACLQSTQRSLTTGETNDSASRTTSIGSGPATPPQHPMERLSFVFQRHPSALRLHRELTIALASGDAGRAADLAGVLAAAVQRVIAPQESDKAASPGADGKAEKGRARTPADASAEIPAPTVSDVEAAVEKTREAVVQRAGRVTGDHEAAALSSSSSEREALSASQSSLPFWRDPKHLCVTVLESAFETEVPEGEAQDSLSAAGNRAAEHEARQVRILETYLEKEADRWKAQKAAIAKIVLDVARALHVTPADIQATEGLALGGGAGGEQRLNVLRHSNFVIRGEIPAGTAGGAAVVSPSVTQHAIDAELAALEERMAALGTPLTPEEAQMARYELQMSRSRMRYVVGVHRELQHALDSSEALQKQQQQQQGQEGQIGCGSLSGTQIFINEVIRALNEGAEAFGTDAAARGISLSVQDVQAREAVETPVLPFTFMLKCCLWFDTAAPS